MLAETQTHIIQAKCVDKSFDCKNAIQYYPGDIVSIDLSNKDQRKLVWIKTLGGKWAFQFDRANSSSTALRIFFCKECGQPFDRLTDHGSHTNQFHNKTKAIIDKTHAANAEDDEEKALAERIAFEQIEDNEQNVMLKNAIEAKIADKEMAAGK